MIARVIDFFTAKRKLERQKEDPAFQPCKHCLAPDICATKPPECLAQMIG